MFEDYSISKFVFAFFLVILLIYGFYFFIARYGHRFSVVPKGEIKIKDIKFFARDKGFILVNIKNEEYYSFADNKML